MTASLRPKISIIVAALIPEYGIGYKGQLPWSLKQEMKYFRKVTTATVDPLKKNAVIMGRKTYHSIPPKFRPLKGRHNVVLTRNPNQLKAEMKPELEENVGSLSISSSLVHTLNSLENVHEIEEIFIIGGAEVYNQLMESNYDIIDRIFLTEVTHDKILPMDAHFNLDKSKWEKLSSNSLNSYLESKNLQNEFEITGNDENDFQFEFTLWEKK
ncbi:dihydrofolate reductase [Martiniozyma asiatica (nom. inval.)]|nr:dihydrofolate reductase [Martiniozyma asiatica]